MSENEELPVFEESELEETTLVEVRESLPRVFAEVSKEEPDVSFIFEVFDIETVQVKRDMPTSLGEADMYILKTQPKIYCFRNAYNHLALFIEQENLTLPAKIKYVGREGTAMKTKYIFEKVKK